MIVLFSELNSQQENSICQHSYQEHRSDNTAAFDELELSRINSHQIIAKSLCKETNNKPEKRVITVERTMSRFQKIRTCQGTAYSPSFSYQNALEFSSPFRN